MRVRWVARVRWVCFEKAWRGKDGGCVRRTEGSGGVEVQRGGVEPIAHPCIWCWAAAQPFPRNHDVNRLQPMERR